MFKVKIVATGEIQTVYGLNGTHFLMYNKELDWWFYKEMDECVPVIEEIDCGMEIKLGEDLSRRIVYGHQKD